MEYDSVIDHYPFGINLLCSEYIDEYSVVYVYLRYDH